MITVGTRVQNNVFGPWALSEDIDKSEKDQVIVKHSQSKSQRWGTNGRQSKEEIILGYDENSSQYVLYLLV